MAIFKRSKKFRILSSDGGGMKGSFTAYAILQLEKEGINIIDYFDMIVGTSTGSIIGASLLKGKPPEEIYGGYVEEENIFKKRNLIHNQLKGIFFPSYDAAGLEEEILKEFGHMRLEDLYKESGKTSFAFFASNFTKGMPRIYSSPDVKVNNIEGIHISDAPVFEAIRGSSAAPFFFEPISDPEGNLILDGGLWANNPSLQAVTMAMSSFNINIDDIEVLSFGQTFIDDSHFQVNRGRDLLKDPKNNDIAQLIISMITMNQNVQTYTTNELLGDNHYRYAPEEEINGAGVDKTSAQFMNYSKLYYRDHKDSLIEFIKRTSK